MRKLWCDDQTVSEEVEWLIHCLLICPYKATEISTQWQEHMYDIEDGLVGCLTKPQETKQ